MGKATGFLEYERKNAAVEEPLKRIRHFNEFRTPLPLEEQQKQGARCLPERSHVSRHGFGLSVA